MSPVSTNRTSIQCEGLRKVYERKPIIGVADASFSVAEGELFGLIGPDGAGKTSIFRMLTTLLLPDGGSASVEGYDVVRDFKEIRKRVGYMPGKFSLYQDLSVEENLSFFAKLFETSISEGYDLIRDIYVQIEPFKSRKAGALSGGMKQKLALCCALVHKPKVLFLDEPTTGVDPVSRKEFWAMLKRLKQQSITILVSTPYMDEATLCDRIALIQSGKILSVSTPSDIIASYPNAIYAVRTGNSIYSLLTALRRSDKIKDAYAFGEHLNVVMFSETAKSTDSPLSSNNSDTELIKSILTEAGFNSIDAEPTTPTIEDCFLSLLKE